ncbi:MAG: dipeptidase [Desulfosarcinaceae bacterium]
MKTSNNPKNRGTSPIVFVIDGHLDSLQALYLPDENPRSLLEESGKGHFDLPRAFRGNFAGGMFAVFVPSAPKGGAIRMAFPGRDDPVLMPVKEDYARKVAQEAITCLQGLAEASNGRLQLAGSVEDVNKNMKKGAISAVLHFEGAEPIASDLSNLEAFYEAGLRSVGPVWSRPNAFGYGVDFRFPGTPDTGPGLTAAGKELVRACNRLGIIIDLSHLNEKGFWDVQRLSRAPLVATHSCMHALTPVTRNLTDRQLDAIRDSNGVVGINFCTGFVRDDARLDPQTPLEAVVRHIDYAVDRMGVEHVAIGSDFDGATIPKAIGDVAGLPRLIQALFAAGLDEGSVRKIAYKNWLRIFADTWREA